MPASTRGSQGITKPRIIQQIESAITPGPKKRATKPKTKANTSKPRDKKVAAGRVGKTKATGATKVKKDAGVAGTGTTTAAVKGPRTKTVKKRTTTEKIKDLVVGKTEKAVGEVEGKPVKKAAGTKKENGTLSTKKKGALTKPTKTAKV